MAQDIVQLSSEVYLLPGNVNMALVVGEGKEAVVVDKGQDKDAGRRVMRACETLSVTPVAIFNTHAHADHFGGNDFLVRNLDLPVYAPPFEASIIENPYLEPVYLFNGAKPPPELMSKWLLAKPSPVAHLLEPGPLELAGVSLELLDTSGHAHTHYAVRVGEVLIAADAVFGVSVLDKYPLPFGQDIAAQIGSAGKVGETDTRIVVPGHGEPSEDVRALVTANLAAFAAAAGAVEAACIGLTSDEVLKTTADTLGLEMRDLPRYYLNRCVVSAYLNYLRETGRVEVSLNTNELRWTKTS